MSERKVINKYYPPDFDPSKIPRLKKKVKPNDVRIMAPFNMKCVKCGEYIATGTKFNAKKETSEEKYEDVLIYKFYIRCPRCNNRIIFRTDPKEKAYEVEEGATENFRALKMAEREKEEAEEAEEAEEKINPMKHLENRTKASKQQMEASEQIENLKALKSQMASVQDIVLSEKRSAPSEPEMIEMAPVAKKVKIVPKPKPSSFSKVSQHLSKLSKQIKGQKSTSGVARADPS